MIRLGGLSSGMDTESVIASILEAEAIPQIRLENEILDQQDKLTAWTALDVSLTALQNKASQLNTYSTWRQKSAASSDTDLLTAATTSTATEGTYDVNITQLAKSHRIGSDAQADTTSALALAGAFTLGGEQVTVTATDSLADIRDAINTASYDMVDSKRVRATIINTTLVLERESAGNTNIEYSDDTGDVLEGLGLLDGAKAVKNQLQAAQDLAGTINTIAISTTSNTGVSTVVDGLSFNFLDTGASTLTVTNDTATIKSLITDFITAYNETMDLAEEQTKVDMAAGDAGEDEIAGLGVLQGDRLVSSIRMAARNIVSAEEENPNYLDASFNSLQTIGIWTSGEANRLEIVNSDVLDTALGSNFDEVEDLFRDLNAGIANKMDDYIDTLVSPLDGAVATRENTIRTDIRNIGEEVDALDLKLLDMEDDLWAQFTRMEESLSMISSQSTYIMGQLGVPQQS